MPACERRSCNCLDTCPRKTVNGIFPPPKHGALFRDSSEGREWTRLSKKNARLCSSCFDAFGFFHVNCAMLSLCAPTRIIRKRSMTEQRACCWCKRAAYTSGSTDNSHVFVFTDNSDLNLLRLCDKCVHLCQSSATEGSNSGAQAVWKELRKREVHKAPTLRKRVRFSSTT